jgi:hypothetical protein
MANTAFTGGVRASVYRANPAELKVGRKLLEGKSIAVVASHQADPAMILPRL